MKGRKAVMANCEKCIKSDVCRHFEPKSTIACEHYVDKTERRHGYWVCKYLGYGANVYECSCCGGRFGEDEIREWKHVNFCADCGAVMDGGG